MEAKDKAKELIDKYFDMKWQSYSNRKTSIKSMTKSASKECARMAVDEILKLSYFTHEPTEDDNLYANFWKQVLSEIDKL